MKEGYDANQRYCFILGSGASYTSGIPTGLKLMPEWHKYLQSKGMEYIRECASDCGISDDKLERIFEPDYEFQSEDYFTLYDLRFAGMPIAAYSYLQKTMEKAEPSIGYYMLALLMDQTENKLVITTNFDSLVEEVLYLYNAKHPLVAGHESLAPFIGTVENMGRPIVAKVHRDLTLQPLNREAELQKLADSWAESLRTAFSKYIPIVIGYAGGDQTLMNLLEKTKLDEIYWCSLKDSESERIENLLNNRPRGYLVKIKGFDEVMFELASKMMEGKTIDRPDDRMNELFDKRIKNYKKQRDKLSKKVVDEETVRSSEEDISSKNLKTRNESTNDSDIDITTTNNSTATAASKLDLLDKIASPDDSLADKVASLQVSALKYYNSKDIDQALKCCDEAIEIQPEDASLHHLKGTILYNIGLYREAIRELDTAIELDPDNARYHYSRGTALYELGRYDESLKEKDKALLLDPENAIYEESRNVTLYAIGRYEEVLKNTDEALELNPDNVRYHHLRSATLYKLGRFNEALEESNATLKLNPNNALYHDSHGTILHKLGRFEEALKESDEALRLDSNNAEYHDNLSATLHELRRYEEALEESNYALRLNPDNARYHDSRGRTLQKLGRFDEAQKEFDEADRLDPENTRYNSGRQKSQ